VQERSSRVLDTLVEDLGCFVFVVPVDVHPGLAGGGGPWRWCGKQWSRQPQTGGWRRVVVLFALRIGERGRRRRRRRHQRRRSRNGRRCRERARGRCGRRRRETAGLSFERRRSSGRQTALRPWRRRWYGSGTRRRGQAHERLLPRCRRWGHGPTAQWWGRCGAARSGFLGRQSVKNVEVRTRLVAHRCCSLCFFFSDLALAAGL
jgi:hypothetical protein